MLHAFQDWLVSRTGADQFWRRWMGEKVPRRLNWWHTLGGLALFLFAVQVVTGLVLAFYYAPTPQAAYRSIEYLQEQVLLGRFLRALHYWGATFMVAAALAHMVRVFFHGAYKPPREVTWASGVVLLLLVLGFGFTGALLPWDQKAYWGTVVGTSIAGLVPGAGGHLKDFLRGGAEVGALTLSRFYAVHVILLPGLTVALVAVHLSLMRRHGISFPPEGEQEGGYEDFYPKYAARDLAVAALALLVLAFVAVLWPAPLEPPADPNASGGDPKPAWYFLAFYQLLKYFPGRLEAGAVLLSGVLLLLLFALPWMDRGPQRNIGARKRCTLAAGCLTLLLAVLTFLGARSGGGAVKLEPRVAALAGGYFFGQKCATCHDPSRLGSAPDFWVRQHAREKDVQLDDSESLSWVVARSLAAYLKTRPRLDLSPDGLRGAALYAVQGCAECHTLSGGAGAGGVHLGGVAARRDRQWLIEHFKDPKKLSPGSKMPAFDTLSDDELGALSDFLLRFR